MNIAICDRDLIFASTLETNIINILKNIGCKVSTEVFTTGEELVANMVADSFYDIIFLDYKLALENLKEWYRNNIKNEYKITFIGLLHTAELDLTSIFDIHPYDCLENPVNKEKLGKILTEVVSMYEKEKDFLFFRQKNMNVRLEYEKILYLYSQRERIFVVTKMKSYCFYGKLSDVIEQMPLDFIRIHQSYVINLVHLKNYTNLNVTMDNGVILNISRKWKNELHRILTGFNKTI